MFTINCRQTLVEFPRPAVMGIVNITPDSFYSESRTESIDQIVARIQQVVAEGADIIDIGACSTRPDGDFASEQEEIDRLRRALPVIKQVAPDALLSIDTFRSQVAKMCVEEFGADIVNDISGGSLDRDMYRTVARLRVPYVLTHYPCTQNNRIDTADTTAVMPDLLRYFAERIQKLHSLGAADVIIDPGFGFGKTLDQNYEVLACLADLQVFNLPVLAGVSRKSMVHKLLSVSPIDSLNGTTALHMLCLMQGAQILRVHDVKAAREAIKIYSTYQQAKETHVQL